MIPPSPQSSDAAGDGTMASGTYSPSENPNPDTVTEKRKKEEEQPSSKPLKAKTTKAERRALQEAQRAAKAVGSKAVVKSGTASPGKNVKESSQKKAVGSKAVVKSGTASPGKNVKESSQKKAEGSKTVAESGTASPGKNVRDTSQKKGIPFSPPSVTIAEGSKAVAESGTASPAKNVKESSQKKGIPFSPPSVTTGKEAGNRPLRKDRKKEAPSPRMQFDDKSRMEKARKRSVLNRAESRNRVELFHHLPQYEHGTQLLNLEPKFLHLDSVHPSVFKVGLRYLAGDISGGNARCIAMLIAFKDAIRDYSTPHEKVLVRDLTSKISSYVSFLTECRPLSMSMGNAIRFLKGRIVNLPLSYSESEAKAVLCSDIDRFINEKIILADKVIVRHAFTKVKDGDVLLTYGSSCVVEMILLYAHEQGKQFRVVVIDSRPRFEGQALLRRLVAKGLSCTYTHINAVSYIMHEVTRVFLGASAILANGTVYSRVGTSCVAMVANAFRVPVLICCEAYKFHERVQLDSICSNELGDPDAIASVPGRMDVKYLHNWASEDNLRLLNLTYDATPSDYVSVIVTDYGMVPTTSVPVIVREYRQEHLLM